MNDDSDPPRYRSAESVRGQRPWPDVQYHARAEVRLRLMALEEVLCRLPPVPYEALRESALQWRWHVDGCWFGRAVPEGSGLAIELAECLERKAWPIVVTVVAHELAHAVLGHVVHADANVQRMQELQAWNELRKWGFGKEADVAEFLLAHQIR
jgi:hypothetical protein